MFRAASFNTVGYGLMQVIRFVTNVVLVRYFIPKGDFGLMAVIVAVNVGLEMLSDMGIGPAIVQNERGEDLDFLNTAWTLQAVRGAMLSLIALVLVYPVALIQDMPDLLYLMPFSALTGVIVGFQSTAIFTLHRRLDFKRVAIMELIGQACGSGGTILIATFEPSAWALVWGGLIRATVDMIVSHLIPVGYHNRFAWHREHLDSIRTFGKWLFGSSALTFLSGAGHKLVLARPMGKEALGVYHVAEQLAGIPTSAVLRLVGDITYSGLSEVYRDRPSELKRLYYKVRHIIDLIAQPALGAISAMAPAIVLLLYGKGFSDAGWMLRILCIRGGLEAVATCSQYCLLAQGGARYSFLMNVGRAVWLVSLFWPAYSAFGVLGVVWTVATVEVPAVVITTVGMKRYGTLSMLRELVAPIMFVIGGAIGWVASPLIPWLGAVLHIAAP